MSLRGCSQDRPLVCLLMVILLLGTAAGTLPEEPAGEIHRGFVPSPQQEPVRESFTASGSGPVPFNLSVPIQRLGRLSEVQLEVSVAPATGPVGPAVSLGQGGPLLWHFPGRFGSVGTFAGGAASVDLPFPAKGDLKFDLDIPEGAYSAASTLFTTKVPLGKDYSYSASLGGEGFWSRARGSAPFSPPYPVHTPAIPIYELATGAINGDSLQDIVGGDHNSNMFTLIGNGAGGFNVSYRTVHGLTGYPPAGLLLTDIDNDSRKDLLYSSSGGYTAKLMNLNGALGAPQPFAFVSDIVLSTDFVDLDGDADLDMVSNSCCSTRMYVFLSPNSTNGGPPETYYVGVGHPWSFMAVDLDADADRDLIVSDSSGWLHTLKNNGSGKFGAPEAFAYLGYPATTLSFGSLDADPRPDILAGTRYGMLHGFLNANLTNYLSEWNRSINYYSYPVEGLIVADLDQSAGKDLLLTTRDGLVSWIRGYGNGTLGPQQILGSVSLGGLSPLLGDADNDGAQDVVLTGVNGGVWMLPNSASGFTDRGDLLVALRKTLVNVTVWQNDSWGNRFVRLPVDVHSDHAGTLKAHGLGLGYAATRRVNITAEVTDYVSKNPANETGFVAVPVNVSAATPGELVVKVVVVYENAPPFLVMQVPSPAARIAEDSVGNYVVDLERYFSDDKDDDRLAFAIAYQSDRRNLTGTIEGGQYLSVFPVKYWSGDATYRVTATDSSGLSATSNNFTVEVYHINHPPEIKNLPSQVKALAKTLVSMDLSPFLHDVEDGDCLDISTSDPANTTGTDCQDSTVPILNLTYPSPAFGLPLKVAVTDQENGTANSSLVVHVLPEFSPIFLSVPPLHTPRGIPRNVSDPVADLSAPRFAFDKDTPPGQLSFQLVAQSAPQGVSFALEPAPRSNRITMAVPNPFSKGFATLWVRVSDGTYSDDTNLTIILDEVVHYLGTLPKSTTVDEDATWSIDLSKHFTRSDVVFSSSYPKEIRIDGAFASWTPVNSSGDLLRVLFTATDGLNQANNDSSGPIDLFFNPVNDPPQYMGGLASADVRTGERWSVDLRQVFNDEEYDHLLTFDVNRKDQSEVEITDGVASWTPDVGSQNLTGVVFTALDGKPPFTKTDSPAINLTLVPKNLLPVSFIDSISPSPAYRDQQVAFRGNGSDRDGHIVGYNWTDHVNAGSPVTISKESEFTARLRPGVHPIGFQVSDDRGGLSPMVWTNLTVLDANLPFDARKPVWTLALIAVGAALFIGGLTVSRYVRDSAFKPTAQAKRKKGRS